MYDTRKRVNSGVRETSDTWQTLPGETAVAEVAHQGTRLTRHSNDKT